MRTPPARRDRRPGISLLELLAVMAVLVILGAVLTPTLGGLSRDTRVKAAGDLLRQRVASARSHAVESGIAYRLAVSADGARVRVTVDDPETAASMLSDDETLFESEDELPKPVTASPATDSGAPADDDGWLRVATFLPDGTCREDSPVIELREPDTYPLLVTVRGLTGAVTVAPAPKGVR